MQPSFSDAVFAIAMTLLVIDVRLPERVAPAIRSPGYPILFAWLGRRLTGR